jgi:hypothetical protein
MPPLLPDDFIPASTNFRHASLSSAFLSLRQAETSSASGICALQSLNASGVQACRSSSVPCAIDVAGEAITHSKAASKHHRFSGCSRFRIHLFWHFALIGRFLPSALNGILMVCTDTVSSHCTERPSLVVVMQRVGYGVREAGRRLRGANRLPRIVRRGMRQVRIKKKALKK